MSIYGLFNIIFYVISLGLCVVFMILKKRKMSNSTITIKNHGNVITIIFLLYMAICLCNSSSLMYYPKNIIAFLGFNIFNIFAIVIQYISYKYARDVLQESLYHDKTYIINLCDLILEKSLPSYKKNIESILSVKSELSEDDYFNKILSPFKKTLFNNANKIIITCCSEKNIKIWKSLLNSDICGYEINTKELSLGQIYAMLYYILFNETALPGECIALNHIEHEKLQTILQELSDNINYSENEIPWELKNN